MAKQYIEVGRVYMGNLRLQPKSLVLGRVFGLDDWPKQEGKWYTYDVHDTMLESLARITEESDT